MLAHNVPLQVGEPSLWNRNRLEWSCWPRISLPPGTLVAISAPGCNVWQYATPNNTCRHQATCGSCSRMRYSMESLENSLPVHFWNERLLAAPGHVEQQLMASHVNMQKLQRGGRCCLLCGWTCQLVFGNAVIVQQLHNTRDHRSHWWWTAIQPSVQCRCSKGSCGPGTSWHGTGSYWTNMSMCSTLCQCYRPDISWDSTGFCWTDTSRWSTLC